MGESKALGVGVNNQYFLENKKKWDQGVYYVIKDYQNQIQLYEQHQQEKLKMQIGSGSPPPPKKNFKATS